MLSPALVLLVGVAYLAGLFVIAWLSDRQAARGGHAFINSPVVYTLSLAVYCTAWTFYGAVGSAVRNGLEFLTIYIGPTIVFLGWWIVLRKIVRICKGQQITSIADFLSARYGKSATVSVVVTLMAVTAITPYIALQLKGIATAFEALVYADDSFAVLRPQIGIWADTGLWVAIVMGVFVVLFGTRTLAADESHPGVVTAIAFESVVKLVALMLIGVFAVLALGPGDPGEPSAELAAALARLTAISEGGEARWAVVTFLSAAAIICLPRQFQIMAVENRNERHLATAAWLFPLYLLLISLFVVPIAAAGLTMLPATADPDLYVLWVPIAAGREELALFAFIGGLSAGTSMVIVSSIALSIMISNHLALPLLLSGRLGGRMPQDLSRAILIVRRLSIAGILALGYVYYRTATGGGALASIGLISFAGVAQFLPALLGAIFWHAANRHGAIAGLATGFVVWAYTLVLPSLPVPALEPLLVDGPFGIAALAPTALFGATGWDPLVHATFWSLLANTAAFVLVSVSTRTNPIGQLQGAIFVDVFRRPAADGEPVLPRSASVEDLRRVAERILGPDRTRQVFDSEAQMQGRPGRDPLPDAHFITRVERALASGIGAASARLMVSRIVKGAPLTVDTVMALLDETRAAIRYSQELERKSAELEETAEKLKEANETLQRLDQMKDDFLSRVSHELRTPMTSIRSFAELLSEAETLDTPHSRRFIHIVKQESQRLTRLLDEILDLSAMESGQIAWHLEPVELRDLLRGSVDTMMSLAERRGVAVDLDLPARAVWVNADPDRLKQVFLNLLSNAIKFADTPEPRVLARIEKRAGEAVVEVIDNGPGVSPALRDSLFSKFGRDWLNNAGDRGGSGLGLAICRQIAERLGGTITLAETSAAGSCFRLSLPLQHVEGRVSAEQPAAVGAVAARPSLAVK
ncbi:MULTISPECIES: sensor histidine kinase [unclassified Roseitalea]|uniref:sensor histidine kinase n=1 Tax=unclassified Roseitalea TaxID=2639107 RepID=UPI00273D21BE|nr:MULTISPECIES: sensor histidine kinase [unclassified Roseitalea]